MQNVKLDWEGLRNAGKMAFEERRFQECEKIWKDALEDAEKNGNDPDKVTISNMDLYELYINAGQYARALPFVEKAVAIREEKFGPNDLTLATYLTSLA